MHYSSHLVCFASMARDVKTKRCFLFFQNASRHDDILEHYGAWLLMLKNRMLCMLQGQAGDTWSVYCYFGGGTIFSGACVMSHWHINDQVIMLSFIMHTRSQIDINSNFTIEHYITSFKFSYLPGFSVLTFVAKLLVAHGSNLVVIVWVTGYQFIICSKLFLDPYY